MLREDPSGHMSVVVPTVTISWGEDYEALTSRMPWADIVATEMTVLQAMADKRRASLDHMELLEDALSDTVPDEEDDDE